MKRTYSLFIFLIVLLFITATISAEAVTLQPGPEGKDTWIWDSQDYSHGDWGELRVNDTSSFNQYTLIEFDLSSIPTGSPITSAILGLYRYGGWNNSGLKVDAHQILSSWTEDVRWSTRPVFNSSPESTTNVYGNGWYTWDITSLAQEWINATTPNDGIALFDDGTSYFKRFVSSDNATATQPSYALPPTDPSYRPYLEVNVVPEPISSILFVTGGATLAIRRYLKRKKA